MSDYLKLPDGNVKWVRTSWGSLYQLIVGKGFPCALQGISISSPSITVKFVLLSSIVGITVDYDIE